VSNLGNNRFLGERIREIGEEIREVGHSGEGFREYRDIT
jgi:hypothetical protein